MSTQQLRGKKYKGTLYARKWGSDDLFMKVSNMTEITTSKDSDSDELTSTAKEDYGEAIEVETIPSPTNISLKSNTYDKHAMARALMGEAVDLETTPQDFNGTFGFSQSGWVKLSANDLDESLLVLTDSNGGQIDSATYKVNATIGMVQFNDTSTLTSGETITYTGKTAGREGYQIDANTLQSITLEMYLDGADRITGASGTLELPHVVLSSDGDMNWFSDDWWETGLSGTLVKDEGKPTMRFTEYKVD